MTNYILNESKMFADVADGVAIVINSETGIYYGMNGLGTEIFDNLIKGVSVDNILLALKQISNVPADIEDKLNAFISELANKELIIKSQAGTADSAVISATAAASDNFEMTVSEYNDAQELLLADPIHEVREETGWTPEKDSIGYTKEETREREKKAEK